jgi:hypothetical protein
LYGSGSSEHFRFELINPQWIKIDGINHMIYRGSGIEFPNNTVASNFYSYMTACETVMAGGKYNTCSKSRFFCLVNRYDSNGNVIGWNKVKFHDMITKESFKKEPLPISSLYCPRWIYNGLYYDINGYKIDRMSPHDAKITITGYETFCRPHILIKLGLIPPQNTEIYLRINNVTMPFDKGYNARLKQIIDKQ